MDSIRQRPLVLRCRDVVALVDALASWGFTESYQLPHERHRFVNVDDTSVVLGFDGGVSIYGDGNQREAVGAALIESGAAA